MKEVLKNKCKSKRNFCRPIAAKSEVHIERKSKLQDPYSLLFEFVQLQLKYYCIHSCFSFSE